MPVYMIRAGETEMVKIGWAKKSAHKRLRSFQAAHWERLHIIREIAGPAWMEREFHARFAERRVRGEWFRFCPTMLTMEPPIEPPTSKGIPLGYGPIIARLSAACVAAGSQVAWAKGVGLSYAYVHGVLKGNRSPGPGIRAALGPEIQATPSRYDDAAA